MHNRPDPIKRGGLPKFDTTGWLSVGIFFSMVIFGLSLWSELAALQESFIPHQLGKILSMGVGLGLGIHCVDMIVYHRKNRRPNTSNLR